MTTFGFGGGFGASQPAQSPFGSSPSPFGAPASVFGQQSSSPFGASSSAGLFGSSTPAFGAAQTPAFGASSAAFGSSTFGARPSGGAFGTFGQTPASNPFASSQPAFGAASTPAFGAQSTPAFGSQPFGASSGPSPFGGGGGFGASSAPAFGSTGFGAASTPAFGSTGFGSGFGQQPGFNMQQQQQGTKNIAYQKVTDQEGGQGSRERSTVHFCSILAMPQFRDANEKSPSELRWEDYQMGVKGNTGSQTPGAFGQGGGFGAQAQSSPFGGTPLFGQASTPAFGQASTPAFGQASTPAFASSFGQTGGAFGQSSGSIFGKPASTPAFGQSSSPFGGNAFAAGSTPAFGQTGGAFGQSTPAFGQQSTPAFGSTGFGAGFGSSTPAFGAQSSPAFGGGGLFGNTGASQQFGASTGFAFNQASSSTFSFPSSTPAFGQASSTPQPFGAASTGGFNFGQAASTPGFGGGGLFGSSGSKPFESTFGATQPFGASSPSPFGASTGGLFGAPASSSAFGGGGLFGSTPNAGSSPFSFNQPLQQQPQAQQPQMVQLPGIATSPYGTLPPAPQMGNGGPQLAEYRVGLSQQPVTGLLAPRTAALLAPRTITPRLSFPSRPLSSRARVARRPTPSADSGLFQSSSTEIQSMILTRDNPRSFYVRDPLPETHAAASLSPSPSLNPSPEVFILTATSALSLESEAPSERTVSSVFTDKHSIKPRNFSQGASREDQATSRGGEGPIGVRLQSSSPAVNGFSPLQQASPEKDAGASAKKPARDERTPESNRQPGSAERVSPGGRAPSRHLMDEEISQLLPKVTKPDTYIEPSLTQLAAMAREDPDSLENVANFKVGNRQYGHVIWREPVDVRGLDVDHLISFSKGTVAVYLQDKYKPPMGEGLNKRAEVNLLGVFKTDKTAGGPLTEQASIDKFVKRLKRTAANQSARFLEYQPQKGLWRFEVDHFSKYGLIDESDSDDEAMTTGPSPSQSQKQPAHAVASTTQSDEAVGMQEGDEVEGPLGSESPVEDASDPLGVLSSETRRAAASPILLHSLPATLNLDPASLSEMRQSLYERGDEGKEPFQRPAKRRPAADFQAALFPPERTSQSDEAFETAAHKPDARTSGKPIVSNWIEHKPAITPPSRQLPSAASSGVVPHSALIGQSCLVTTSPQAAKSAESDNFVEAGAALGRSFRVGWGLNNAFVHPGTLDSKGKASTLITSQLRLNQASHGKGNEAQNAERDRLRALLEVHFRSSQCIRQSEGQLAEWRLNCSPLSLPSLCKEFCRVNEEHGPQVSLSEQSCGDLCLQQESAIWQLLAVLFGHISPTPESSQDPQNAEGGRTDLLMIGAEEDTGAEAQDNFEEDEQEHEAEMLMSFKRRAALSQWLRELVRRENEEGLSKQPSALESIALLLSGGDLLKAASVAASSGYVRLAINIAQAGGSMVARQDLADQLQCWQRSELDRHIDPKLLSIFNLLAGNPTPLTAQMDLGWHRAFGLYLWYASPHDAPLEHALKSYTDAASTAGTAPQPSPLYAEKTGWVAGQRRTADMIFTLLQLATGGLSLDNPLDMAQLLSAEGHAPEPLAALHGWLVLQTLIAIGIVERTPSLRDKEAILASDLIAQLHTVGGLPEWEIYVAMHLPRIGPSHAPDSAVAELLCRNARGLARDASKRKFLYELGIPRAWVADGLATFARSSLNKPEELHQLLEAEHWIEAHKLLVDHLAPAWLLSEAEGKENLQTALETLLPHRAKIEEEEGSGSFQGGAGLYSAYLALKEVDADRSLGPDEEDELANLLISFASQLSDALTTSTRGSPRFAYYQVLSQMADDAAQWLLKQSSMTQEPRQALEWQTAALQMGPLLSHTRRNRLQTAAVLLSSA